MTACLRIGASLSLSGRFAQFGQQAAAGLKTWAALDGRVVLVIEGDRSDKDTLRTCLPAVAARRDLLVGPYSTILMRAAGNTAAPMRRTPKRRVIAGQRESGRQVDFPSLPNRKSSRS